MAPPRTIQEAVAELIGIVEMNQNMLGIYRDSQTMPNTADKAAFKNACTPFMESEWHLSIDGRLTEDLHHEGCDTLDQMSESLIDSALSDYVGLAPT
jgi:hypothetical protein